MEQAIHLMTDAPARFFGLRDRGRVAEGWVADLVVFDPATVDTGDVVLRTDLPGGCGRLYADAKGIGHVFVNGRRIVADGSTTGDLPGSVLRSGRDTETVLIPAARSTPR
jgi:N-acyl-D-aspartate/D-glutamate deacylase